MTLDLLRQALLWCTIINFGVLLVWTVMWMLPHQWIHRIWRRWFRLSDEQFDMLMFATITIYKIGVLLFNLVPYIALQIVG